MPRVLPHSVSLNLVPYSFTDIQSHLYLAFMVGLIMDGVSSLSITISQQIKPLAFLSRKQSGAIKKEGTWRAKNAHLYNILLLGESLMVEILCHVISIMHGLFRKFWGGMLLAGGMVEITLYTLSWALKCNLRFGPHGPLPGIQITIHLYRSCYVHWPLEIRYLGTSLGHYGNYEVHETYVVIIKKFRASTEFYRVLLRLKYWLTLTVAVKKTVAVCVPFCRQAQSTRLPVWAALF